MPSCMMNSRSGSASLNADGSLPLSNPPCSHDGGEHECWGSNNGTHLLCHCALADDLGPRTARNLERSSRKFAHGGMVEDLGGEREAPRQAPGRQKQIGVCIRIRDRDNNLLKTILICSIDRNIPAVHAYFPCSDHRAGESMPSLA